MVTIIISEFDVDVSVYDIAKLKTSSVMLFKFQ